MVAAQDPRECLGACVGFAPRTNSCSLVTQRGIMNAKGTMMAGETNEPSSERQPMPAFRNAETRRKEIANLVGYLLKRSPELLEDVHVLTTVPAPDERALSEGYGPYGHDYVRAAWAHLARDVVASEDEIRSALEAASAAQVAGSRTTSA